ncbi:flagellar motor protein MotB [Alienimonas californiensis]|uniref:Flagellar motor protein MotB n=1 Tax=Alienimonas californiensis TaxID=2527989 RepID=A0A517PAA0_9PLAN|nr:flagellar motor protein MotB [Alienimonas californiensis]QDT16292.1 flagellar motor protein MotB [Alienimonas californiensis]
MDDDAPPGVPEWVVTYGDMMSLLLTFFIMLVSMSEIKEKSKYREVLASLHDRLGYPAGALSAPGDETAGTVSDSIEAEAGTPPVAEPGDGGTPRPTSPGAEPMLTREPAGRPVPAGAPALFEPNTDRLAKGEEARLDAVADSIAGKLQVVELRGFAPADEANDFDTLAYRRARIVLGELVRRGVRPDRFRLRTGGVPMSHATFGPDAPPPDRVEIWVLDRLAPAPRGGR